MLARLRCGIAAVAGERAGRQPGGIGQPPVEGERGDGRGGGDGRRGGDGTGTAADQTKRHPDGTPVNLDLFLKVGDVVEVKSPSIGSLINHIVAK